jgi:hypothetical protein
VQVGIPGDALQAVRIEAVDDLPHPLRGAAGLRGDVAVAQAAAGEQDDAGVPAVDGVGALALEAVQLPVFLGPQGAYHNSVHGLSPHSRCWRIRVWRLFYAQPPATRPSTTTASAKLTDWTRH